MTTHLVLGGTRSGKSEHAERLAAGADAPVVYVATGQVTDAEMAERVATHRDRRPDGWHVIESADVAAALAAVDPHAAVLVDDLEGWLIARMSVHGLWTDEEVAPLGGAGAAAADAVVAEAVAWWDTARRRHGATVVVAGQPGLGPTPLGASARRYVDLHGRVVARLAEGADAAVLMVAGRPLPLPEPDVAADTSTTTVRVPDPALRVHGDRQVPPGAVDLAVNVLPGPPAWLRPRLAACLDDLAAYPDDAAARTALAARHGRDPHEVVPLAGAADGLWLLPRVLRPRLAACVHPGFTEGEAALTAAGVPVVQVLRDPDAGWRLDPGAVPDDADLVLLGRPENPSGTVDRLDTIAALARPGRTLVVDEAFAEFLPDGGGLASLSEVPGLVALRSLTKLWGLAALRVGYLVAAAPLAARIAAARQPWAVDRVALEALTALAGAEHERRRRAEVVAAARDHLIARLRALPGARVWDSAANFVLLRTPLPDLRERLLADGFAVRRGDTFPGLDTYHVRITVRTPELADRLAAAIAPHLPGGTRRVSRRQVLADNDPPGGGP